MVEGRAPSLLALFALAVALWSGEHALRGLWEPDEARYAYVAREMREDDRWLVPHIHGEPYPDKPPLMFWLINASAVLTGGDINAFSARLPSLLGAIMALWATARLLERWADGRAAWRGVLVLATSHLFWKHAGWGQIDMLFCGLQMMSLHGFFTSEASDGSGQLRTRRLVLAYVFAGLAILAKGPVGLAVPMGVFAVATWFTGGRGRLRSWHWGWGTVLAAAIPGAWLFGVWLQGAPEGYFAAMFGVKSFGRVIEDAGHGRPFYYYLTHFPPEFLPWTVFLPAAWIGLGPGPTRRRLAAWAAFVLVLFSLFAGKRNLYILLAYPAAAMLVATGWGGMAGVSSGWRRFTAWGALALLGLVALGSAVAIGYPDLPISRGSVVPTAVAALAGFVLSLLLYRRQGLSDLWLRAYAGSFAVVLFTVGTFAFPAANHLKGPGLVASRAHDVLEPGHPIHLFRHQLAIVPLYAERPGRMLRSADELRALLDRGSVEIVVFSAVDWASIRDDFDGPMEVHPFEFGHKDLVWVEFPGRRGG